MEIKTETEVVISHKVGVWLTIEEINTCIEKLVSETSIVTEFERKIASDLSVILKQAKKTIEDIDETHLKTTTVEKDGVVTEADIMTANSGACVSGNCD
jgi:hypothetical protein